MTPNFSVKETMCAAVWLMSLFIVGVTDRLSLPHSCVKTHTSALPTQPHIFQHLWDFFSIHKNDLWQLFCLLSVCLSRMSRLGVEEKEDKEQKCQTVQQNWLKKRFDIRLSDFSLFIFFIIFNKLSFNCFRQNCQLSKSMYLMIKKKQTSKKTSKKQRISTSVGHFVSTKLELKTVCRL